MLFFIKGVMMGLAIAAPVGPIALLCMQRTFANGIFSGLATGLGAAVADAIFGAIAVFGLTSIIAMMQNHLSYIQVIGGCFLLIVAFRILMKLPAEGAPLAGLSLQRHSLREIFSDFTSTLLLMLANPMAILLFLAVFSGLGIGNGAEEGYRAPLLLVAGVFAGSMIWWCFLAGTLSFFRDRFNAKVLRLINILSAALIAGFGAMIVAQVFVRF